MRRRPVIQDTANVEQGNADGSARPGISRAQLLLAIALGLAIATLVLEALGTGTVLLLDWVTGPHDAVPRSFLGLDGGLTAAPLLQAVRSLLTAAFGYQLASWIPIVVFFPLATASMATLVPGSTIARLSAAGLFAFNPFVAERLWVGHMGVLLGYAVLPLFVRSLMAARNETGITKLRPAVWIAALTAVSPHWIWICGVIFIVVVLSSGLRLRSLTWVVTTAIAIAAMSVYLLPSTGSETGGFAVGDADLRNYATHESAGMGLYATVLFLKGFWRQGEMPEPVTGSLVVGMVLILIVAAIGVRSLLRDERSRLLAACVLTSGAACYLLALGSQGPTGWLFTFLFEHLPGFAIMREPQKFVSVLVLAVALFFGCGVHAISSKVTMPVVRGFAATIVALLPLLVAGNMAFGYSGELKASHFPDSWQRAQQTMGPGEGAVLYLPWHQYARQTFTGGRTIAEPADVFFDRTVIQGDNVELEGLDTSSQSTRSAYLESLFERSDHIRSMGQLVSPLGVEYVVLSKTNDWRRFEWVAQQDDLRMVYEDASLTVLHNERYVGAGYAIRGSRTFESADDLIAVSNREDLTKLAWLEAGTKPLANERTSGAAHPNSSVSYTVADGEAGYYSLREPRDAGWSGALDVRQITGIQLVTWDGRGSIFFSPWSTLRLLYGLSLLSTLLVVIYTNRRHLRLSSRMRSPLT